MAKRKTYKDLPSYDRRRRRAAASRSVQGRFCDIVHPTCASKLDDWRKWRLTYESGECYKEEYLLRLRREKWQDFCTRYDLTYVPPVAKEAVNEVINAVFRRLSDVSRTGGPESFLKACQGELGGVDRENSAMSAFIGEDVLPELLTMRQVGVWVDMDVVEAGATKADVRDKHPYLYTYPVECIQSWQYDDQGKLAKLLLKECDWSTDEVTGLPVAGEVTTWVFAEVVSIGGRDQVHVVVQDEDGEELSSDVIDVPEIPFVIAEVKHSLLQDVCDMQRTLLNMESSDAYWCVMANFPIYVENRDSRDDERGGRPAQQGTILKSDGTTAKAGQAKEAGEAKDQEVTLGTTRGRSYGKGLNPPQFVHPSSEPITAAMAKERAIKEDVRKAVHLAVAMLDPRMASAESKQMDNEGLQNGLLAVGMALERLERGIAKHWAAYSKAQPSTIRYPEEWTMQSDAGRRADAEALCKLKDEVPSITAAKEIAKQAARKLVGHKVAPAVMDKIEREIDAAQCVTFNIDTVEKEIQLGIASSETVSTNRGYSKEEHAKAQAERIEMLKQTAIAQTPGGGLGAAADPARGGIGPPTDNKSQGEKLLDANKDGKQQDNTRGGGK